ncbi:MAG: hypothetical protein AAB668_01065 [Patescibacteria group bacterium]
MPFVGFDWIAMGIEKNISVESMEKLLAMRRELKAEWIVPISNALESIKMDIKRLEPLKKAPMYEKTSRVEEVYSRWGGQRESNP